MISIKFKLHRFKAVKRTSIQLYFYLDDNRILCSTGQSIDPKYWDENKSRAIVDPKRLRGAKFRHIKVENERINSSLDKINGIVSELVTLKKSQKVKVTKKDIVQVLVLNGYRKDKVISTDSLSSYLTSLIKDMKSGKVNTPSGNNYSPNSIRVYVGFENLLNLFQANKYVVDFDRVTLDFYEDFIAFCHSKKFSPNTIGKHIKILKVVMRRARDKGLHKNLQYENRAFKKQSSKDSSAIYLSDKEIEKLRTLELTKALMLHRDLFLVGCYTGLRFSDYSRVNRDNIRTLEGNKEVIDFLVKKGAKSKSDRVIIPLRIELKKMLESYDYDLPEYSQQKHNDALKDIGRLAGFDSLTIVEKTVGGLKKKSTKLKYELITSHTARRSALTNMYKAGIPVIDIMKISGHSTISSFMRYIRVDKEETALRLMDHPYFKMKVV